tara:strand:+ start:5518 stop:6279 length:762 start_codon:yes stop_codon:yes gene_type:complete
MGFLNNTSVTVDAILTKKGRELLARGQNEFQITKFALSDDEIDYNLWDTTHPNGSNYYGAVIENMPLLESFVDENQVMRFKLITLPKNTAKMPILEVPSPSLAFNGPGITQVVSPNTRNGSDNDSGFMFILHDASIANLTPVAKRRKKRKRRRRRRGGGLGVPNFGMNTSAFNFSSLGITQNNISDLQVNTGATTPVFLNEAERKKSVTLTGKKVNVVSRSITTQTSTNLTVVGIDSGAVFNVVVTVKPAPTV